MDYKTAKQDVIARNVSRQEADLPLLDVEKETSKTLEAFKQQEYNKFYLAQHDKALNIVLEQRRKTNPDYKIDSFMKSVSVGTEVSKLVKQWWVEQNAET